MYIHGKKINFLYSSIYILNMQKQYVLGTEVVDLSYTVPPATLIERTDNFKELNFSGEIKQIIIVIPPGCEDLVTVRVGVNSFDKLAFANKEGNYNFNVSYMVKEGDRIWAEIENADSAYKHAIAVSVVVEKRAEVL